MTFLPLPRQIKCFLWGGWGVLPSLTMVDNILQWPGKWNGHVVGLRLLEIKDLGKTIKKRTKHLLLWMTDHINQANVLKFHGLSELQLDRYVVSDYCSKGSLDNILKDQKYNLTKDFRFSLSMDIATGVTYLHHKDIIHGLLKTASCLVDFRWTVKIADWEYCKIFTNFSPNKNPILNIRKKADDIGKDEAAFLDFWVAPELVKSDFKMHPTAACDVYSYAIIIQHIFTRKNPYHEHSGMICDSDLLTAIVNNDLRPKRDDNMPSGVRNIIENSWCEDPLKRPTSDSVQKMLRSIHSFRKSVLDSMMEAVDDYTVALEKKLEVTSAQLDKAEQRIKMNTYRTEHPQHLQPTCFYNETL